MSVAEQALRQEPNLRVAPRGAPRARSHVLRQALLALDGAALISAWGLAYALGPGTSGGEMEPPALNRRQLLVKRALDLVVASAVLVLATPLLVLAALAVKLGDGGPILFRQLRVGSMSLVGPRPALPEEVARFDDDLLDRHRVPVTGLWQREARENASVNSEAR